MCAGAGAFFVLYSAVVRLDLSSVPHGMLSVLVVGLSVAASAAAGWSIDRFVLNPPFRRSPEK